MLTRAHIYVVKRKILEAFLVKSINPSLNEQLDTRDISRDYLGIALFISRMTKREVESIATLRTSDNIRRHNEI